MTKPEPPARRSAAELYQENLISDELGWSILDTPITCEDVPSVVDIRTYLRAILSNVWHDPEFGAKRGIAGESGWRFDFYAALVKAGHLRGVLDPDEGWLDELDDDQRALGDELIDQAINTLTAHPDD